MITASDLALIEMIREVVTLDQVEPPVFSSTALGIQKEVAQDDLDTHAIENLF